METWLSRWTAKGRRKIVSRWRPSTRPKAERIPTRDVNTPEGVVRNRDLALAIAEQMIAVQGMTNIRRFTIGKRGEQIQANTYILTFNQPHILKASENRVLFRKGWTIYPSNLWCFKCQAYGHHSEACRGRQTCAKCSEKEPGQRMKMEIKCSNCRQDQPDWSRFCDVYKKENEILEEKRKRNMTF